MEEFLKKILELNGKGPSDHMKKHHPGAPEGMEYMDWHSDMPEPRLEKGPYKPGKDEDKFEFLKKKRKY